MTLFYVIALLAAFYLLLIAEFFIPSGGMLGTAAVAALGGAAVIAFSHSVEAGIGVIVFVLATTPFVVIGMVRLWPHTAVGRRLLNRRPGQLTESPVKKTNTQGRPLKELIGRIGTAKTDLLPSGMVLIDGEKLDAVSTGMPLDAGTTLIVSSVEGGRLHVRAANDDELSESDEPPPPKSPPSLEGSLESFDIE